MYILALAAGCQRWMFGGSKTPPRSGLWAPTADRGAHQQLCVRHILNSNAHFKQNDAPGARDDQSNLSIPQESFIDPLDSDCVLRVLCPDVREKFIWSN